ncbi:nitroreductase family deazaflavin-dependent oxidoreductase [Saccharothrix syringae]|uniref:Nitroreductase family deazaflavin-dependent oxidoreductase n=1 Tax=Saccharothrix syringae TaxID=103733 RepID=A0A5Q0H1T2_SACSY|nr:nitroreductase family deazaflavin-dependent oxidoreductase [Saccharothrix syringae]QFZ19814.1 nitroreductase family deazaflavin-dependent oxidoreductase [Saccharothrix syringae]
MSEERRVQNQQVIDEFRANAGVVGGAFEGMTLLLLHHTGARSGEAHVSPLACVPDGDRWLVAAANGGRPHHPAWYFNLLADPSVVIEFGTDTHQVTARVAEGGERDEPAGLIRTAYPFFADFERATTRQIPVLVLERR